MSWLLRLYPRAWRERYGDELAEIVAARPASPQLVLDLLGGAIDAHLTPTTLARRLDGATTPTEGETDMVFRLKGCCAVANMTTRESLLSAGLSLLAGVGLAGYLMTGPSQFAEAVALSTFPAFLAAPTQWMMTRGHSRVARCVLICAPFLVCCLIGVLAGWYVTS